MRKKVETPQKQNVQQDSAAEIGRRQLSEDYFYIGGDPLVLYYEYDNAMTYGKYILESVGMNKGSLTLDQGQYDACEIDYIKRSTDNMKFLVQRHCGDNISKFLLGVKGTKFSRFAELEPMKRVNLNEYFDDDYYTYSAVLGWLDETHIIVRQTKRGTAGVVEDYFWYAPIDDLRNRMILDINL